MADIAILVAEEYEKRVKNSGKSGAGGIIDTNWVPAVLVITGAVKSKINPPSLEPFNKIIEPRSQIGLAASTGFFSA